MLIPALFHLLDMIGGPGTSHPEARYGALGWEAPGGIEYQDLLRELLLCTEMIISPGLVNWGCQHE
jgi:hypothetical protein